jgi:microcystin-dependent protein
MSDVFVGEIRIVGFNFAPTGWALCNGQLLPISQNTALFSLLGTTYGGDGRSTFGLPNLQGSAPMHFGQGPGLSLYDQGETGGATSVTLLTTEMPAHNHLANAAALNGNLTSPANAVWAMSKVGRQGLSFYDSTLGSGVSMNPFALTPTGSSLPHNNMPPFLTMNFVIALQGIFPARS